MKEERPRAIDPIEYLRRKAAQDTYVPNVFKKQFEGSVEEDQKVMQEILDATQQVDITKEAITELYSIAALLLTDQMSNCPEDWKFLKTTPVKDKNKVLNKAAQRNQFQTNIAIRIKRVIEKLRTR